MEKPKDGKSVSRVIRQSGKPPLLNNELTNELNKLNNELTLRQFKNDFRNSELVHKQASALYLWTEKGAWLHAKSLNTDEAWDAYEMLVDDYYNHKQNALDVAIRRNNCLM